MALQATLSAFANTRNQIFCPSQTMLSTKLGAFCTSVGFPSAKLTGRINASSSLTNKLAVKAQKSSQLETRPQVSFPPTIWGDSFCSFSFKESEYESYTKHIAVLKEKVKNKLIAIADDPTEKINFINLLSRLGLSYHFEEDIEKQLAQSLDALINQVANVECDLYSVALVFRVLRQNGYKISCDVFNKFKGNDGKFKQSLTTDLKGMLSLYEAAYLGVSGEDILDEALAFTRPFLESYIDKSSSDGFGKQIVSNSLKYPLHRGMPRVEARQYISLYEVDESRDEMLLNFAKLDFNRIQLLHQKELSYISNWWGNLDFVSKFPYARDRIVELYFWMIGVFFEPEFARSRVFVTQILILLSVVDDTYDGYGTLRELQCFTDGIERWDTSSLDEVPRYLKVLYKTFLDIFDQFENEMEIEGREYTVTYVKNEVIRIIKAYMAEAQWFDDGYVPPLDEYMNAAFVTGGIPVIIAASYAGMTEVEGTKAFEWLLTNPKIIKAAGTISRLMDDIVSHKDEQERSTGHVASSVECYMNHFGVSEEEATEEMQRRLVVAWKDINEECMRPTTLPMSLLKPIINIVRVTEVNYKYIDGYTNPEYVKDYIKSMFINPIPI